MFAQSHASGNTFHVVGVIIPIESDDDDRWIRFAGEKLAKRFGRAQSVAGVAGWALDGEAGVSPVVIVHSYPPEITDLDRTILFGIGWQVYLGLGRRKGTAVIIDDDTIAF
jgi:hypothetical protein